MQLRIYNAKFHLAGDLNIVLSHTQSKVILPNTTGAYYQARKDTAKCKL